MFSMLQQFLKKVNVAKGLFSLTTVSKISIREYSIQTKSRSFITKSFSFFLFYHGGFFSFSLLRGNLEKIEGEFSELIHNTGLD